MARHLSAMRLLRAATLYALLLPGLASAFEPEAYRPVELSQVATFLTSTPDSLTLHIDAAQARYRSSVTFTGRLSPLGDDLRELLRRWARALGHPPSHVDLFTSEVEMTQGTQRYRMPLQGPLVAPFQEEVPPNSRGTVYVLLLGGIDQMPVFAINAFEADPPVSPGEPERAGKP